MKVSRIIFYLVTMLFLGACAANNGVTVVRPTNGVVVIHSGGGSNTDTEQLDRCRDPNTAWQCKLLKRSDPLKAEPSSHP